MNLKFFKIVKLISLLFILNCTHTFAYSMTELEVLQYKHNLSKSLNNSITNEPQFRMLHDQYKSTSFFNNSEIEKSLIEHFDSIMKQEIINRATLNYNLKKHQMSQSQKYMKNSNFGKLTQGALSLGLSSLGTFLIYKAIRNIFSSKNLEYGNTMLAGAIVLPTILSYKVGLEKIRLGWSYTENLKRQIEEVEIHIKILDSNYAYAYPKEDKLSLQIARLGPVIFIEGPYWLRSL